ncbi:MAG: hypothetical protein ACFCBW_06205, partial [Candidatus Competibacterales bacterium]
LQNMTGVETVVLEGGDFRLLFEGDEVGFNATLTVDGGGLNQDQDAIVNGDNVLLFALDVTVGGGDDLLVGTANGALGDRLDGGGGDDTLIGGQGGADTLIGGSDGDLLLGEGQRDVLTGGSGIDTFALNSFASADVITDFAAEDFIAVDVPLANLLTVGGGTAQADTVNVTLATVPVLVGDMNSEVINALVAFGLANVTNATLPASALFVVSNLTALSNQLAAAFGSNTTLSLPLLARTTANNQLYGFNNVRLGGGRVIDFLSLDGDNVIGRFGTDDAIAEVGVEFSAANILIF